mmetsp:Transcript_31157/g.81699  ORF Transcript_31157/g.81699 Transcript_31157/m.81699 type:complete len:231 (+) Transcript_31157:423-1115(+)
MPHPAQLEPRPGVQLHGRGHERPRCEDQLGASRRERRLLDDADQQGCHARPGELVPDGHSAELANAAVLGEQLQRNHGEHRLGSGRVDGHPKLAAGAPKGIDDSLGRRHVAAACPRHVGRDFPVHGRPLGHLVDVHLHAVDKEGANCLEIFGLEGADLETRRRNIGGEGGWHRRELVDRVRYPVVRRLPRDSGLRHGTRSQNLPPPTPRQTPRTDVAADEKQCHGTRYLG